MTDLSSPTLAEIAQVRRRIGDRIHATPVWRWRADALESILGADTQVWLKLELFQVTGSFKPRGALATMLALSEQEISRGVTAVSAGNHAMAVAYAARCLRSSAKVVMPRSANPVRVEGCRRLGAEVVLVDDVQAAFEETRRIERDEGRFFVHPFEGRQVALGTATLGLELHQQCAGLQAVIVPIGGGGLCAGVASALKQLDPTCRIYGVEPEGADSMHRSFAAGSPQKIDVVRTIADSLGAPHAAPYTFALCRKWVDQLVMVDDDQICRAMALLYQTAKLATEPAGAAAAAALLWPLSSELKGKRVGLIVCGSNLDVASFARFVQRGLELGAGA